MVTNNKNQLNPTRTVIGWQVCMDSRMLTDATCKDHFRLPLIDKMIELLSDHLLYCFLDGFLGYIQIPIDPKDQENTIFTCPSGTFAYR